MDSPRPSQDDENGGTDAADRAVLEAASLFSLEPSLAAIAEGARAITGALFGAVGLAGPDPEEFSVFVTAGLTDAEIDAIGPLPRVHGLLGAVLAEGTPLRAADIRADPRASGWWPSAHPPMTALLGAPLRVGGRCWEPSTWRTRRAARPSRPSDEAALVRLADRAAPLARALRQAEDGRLLVLSAERARIARDLHDALSQSLFSIGLRADAARRDLTGAPERADGHLASIADTAREARAELGAVVEGLRPPAIDDEGLPRALRGLAAVLDRLGEARRGGGPDRRARALARARPRGVPDPPGGPGERGAPRARRPRAPDPRRRGRPACAPRSPMTASGSTRRTPAPARGGWA